MELPSTKGPSSWEAAGGNIPDGMYTMIEFDEDNMMEDGKPAVNNPPNNTAKTDTLSPKKRDLSHI